MKPQIFNHLFLVHLSYDAGRFPKKILLIYAAILILTIRTSKFGGHYMPVILREQLTVTTVA
jgi:hypothetical protein